MENKNLTSNQSLPVSTTVKLINTNRHADIIRCLATNIEEAQSAKPIKQLMYDGAEKHKIENIVAVLVLQHARLLNVSGNLQEGQALEIAKALVDEFPYNSIDDFKLMLQNGIRSKYGVVYRFDIAVVFDWMYKYIDEFYEYREEMIRKQKSEEPKKLIPGVIDDEKAKEYLKKWLEIIETSETKNPSPITEEEVKQEGREKPNRQVHRSTTIEEAILHQKRIQWMRECFDIYTGRPNPNHMSFEEWLLKN